MKIAILHDFLLRLGGAERVLKKISDIYPDAPIYTLLYDEKKCGNKFPKEKIKTSFLQKIPFHKKIYRVFLPWMPVAIESFDFSKYDILISSSTALAHGAITNLETKHISFVHSPPRYAWDYFHKYIKERTKNPISKILTKKAIKKIRQWDAVAGDRPDKIIANSKTVQKRIKKYWRQKSDVIYPFVNTQNFKISKTDKNYFLIISQLTSFKNIELAISVFNKLNLNLKIIGTGPQEKYLKSISNENIKFLERVSDKLLAIIIADCKAFIFPGEEDFGIAPLEANACGKKVLALKKGGLTESQISEKTCEFFTNSTTESFEKGLIKIIKNKSKENPEFIRKNAEKFSEEKFEKQIKKVVKEEYEKLKKLK